MSEKIVTLNDCRKAGGAGRGGTAAEFRVCSQCVHHKFKDPRRGFNATGNNVCGAITREKARDPVTGEERYIIENDLGRRVFVHEPHPDCYDMNPDGKCPNFVSIATLGK